MKIESSCTEHKLVVSFFILGDGCVIHQTKVGCKQSGQSYYLSPLKSWDWRWCEHCSMHFWDLHAPWLELLRVHIWPSMQNLWLSFVEGLGHYNTFWVLWLVNKMTNVFFNYNCNYMVMLMTIVAKDTVVPWFCNCNQYDNLMIFNANMLYI